MKVSHQETYLKQVHPTSMVHGQRDSPDQGWKAGMWSDRQCLAALRNAPSSSALVLEVWLSSAEYVKLLSLASTVLREGKCVIIARPPEGSLPSTKLVALLQQKEVLAFFFFFWSAFTMPWEQNWVTGSEETAWSNQLVLSPTASHSFLFSYTN